MNVEFQFVGKRQMNVPMPGMEAVPNKGDTVLWVDADGFEHGYDVKHVYYIVNDDEIRIQVVLNDRGQE
jgi:hypothetical protein